MSGGKKVSTTAEKIANISLQTSCYGACIPIVWGRTRVSPNLIYYTDFKATKHTTTQQTGKGGGSSISNTTFTYSATVVLAVAEGPVSFGTTYHDKEVGTAASFGFTTFSGTQTQTPWSYLSTYHPTDAIAFSGTAYVAQANIPLSSSATLGNYSFEVTGPFSIGGGPGSPDANPADIVNDFLTNAFYSVGWSPSYVGALAAYRTYCTAMGLFLSPSLNTQKAASDHLKEILTATNSEAVPSAGMLKIVPYGDVPVVNNGATFTPDTTPQYNLTNDDFIVDSPDQDPVKVKRKSQRDTYNSIPVEFLDRSNYYNTNTVVATEPVDAASFGIRTGSTESLHSICVHSIAQVVSRILAQRSIYIRNTYEFRLGWRFARLEPMDLVSLTDAKLQLSGKVVRIKQIAEDSKGTLTVTAEEWPFGVAHAPQYITQSSDVAPVNQLVAPGSVNPPAIFDFPPYLTSTGGAALGLAASGGPNYGGCQVYMSSDNSTYAFAGELHGNARYGTLSATFPVGAAYDTGDTLGVDLTISGGGTLSTIDAALNADFGNLALVENELISFQTATLTAVGQYNLTNIYRGALGTRDVAHASGARFVRMDDNVLEVAITSARIGTQLYFKFLAFNSFGKALQSLSDVSPYTYIPAPGFNLSQAASGFAANGTVNGIAFAWGSNLLPGSYVVELWEGTTAGAYAGGTAVKIWEGNATGKLIAKADTTTRYYWLRARAGDGRNGAVTPSGNGQPGGATVVTSSIVLSASPGSATSTGTATSQTTNPVSVSVAGGTAPYLYAWTWFSGGSGIAITSASSSSTTFSATGLALKETRTGTARCVVTDNLGQAQTVYVSISISETASAVNVSASPTTVSVGVAAASETTPSTTASASGGLGPYTYAWTWQSGGTGITATSAAAASTTFSASGLGPAEVRSGSALCTATDSLGQTATCTVSVSITRASSITASASPTSESTSSAATAQTTGTTTVTASGGQPGYTYAWTWQTGGTGISIDVPGSNATSFSASGMSTSGETRTGTALCTVTDALGQTGSCTVSVSIQVTASVLQVTASPSSVEGSGGSKGGVTPISSNYTTASASGGTPGYTYAWSWVSNPNNIGIGFPAAASTFFSKNMGGDNTITGTAQVTVTDALGVTATAQVSVTLNHFNNS